MPLNYITTVAIFYENDEPRSRQLAPARSLYEALSQLSEFISVRYQSNTYIEKIYYSIKCPMLKFKHSGCVRQEEFFGGFHEIIEL